MKILLSHPGASFSIHDYWMGYDKAFRRAGVEVINYALAGRIDLAASWLMHCWKKSGLPKERKPNGADFIYKASIDILERALRFDVDWVVIVSGMFIHPDAVVMLKKAGLRLCMMATESPYDTEHEAKLASYCHVVFTNERTAVSQFSQVCPRSYYLPHAYDPERHNINPPGDDVPAHDVLFVGSGFPERIKLLSEIDWSGIDLALYGCWDGLPARHRLRKYIKDKVIPNEYAAQLYKKAKINLNMHRHFDSAESLNPRVYELAACEAFFITDYRRELEDIFTQIPIYSNAEDLQIVVNHFLANEDLRENIKAEMNRNIQGRTFDERVKTIIRELEYYE